uniref:Copia protein n=1 Tax=Cajanus cajan TaxID=3821 RepID=A0A151SGA2_CAJCA|nr:hypothetical protein KK1_000037 [Cajanus cajan]
MLYDTTNIIEGSRRANILLLKDTKLHIKNALYFSESYRNLLRIWLRSVIQHIRETCGLSSGKMTSTIIYEDNAACIAQLKDGYIKGDRTKHILPKFFFTHDLQRNGDINVQQVRSSDNLTDLFTKSLPRKVFEQLIHKIGLRRLKDCMHEGEK